MTSDLIDPSEFVDLPRTETEWRRQVWARLARIEKQTTATNGRVTRIERAGLILGGIGVGLGFALGLNVADLVSLL